MTEPMPAGFDDRGVDPGDFETCPRCNGLGCEECGDTGTANSYTARQHDCREDEDSRREPEC